MSERKVEAFVIHLARATQRRAQVERIVAACPLKTRVLDAVDGRAMSEDERAAVYRADLHEPRYPFRIGPGEIGCFLSHRNAWQTMLDEGLDASLIPQALAGGYADSAILRHHWEQMRERQFDPPTGYAWVNLKDLDMAIDLSRQLQTQAPMTSQAANIYRALIARGHGDLDTLAIFKLYDDPPV